MNPAWMFRKVALSVFDLVLPFAVRWAEGQERRILAEGEVLTDSGMEDARRAGVKHPERIRMLAVSEIPVPENGVLRFLGGVAGLTSTGTAGMALRYGLFVREEYRRDRALVIHECVHTAQYERMGGFEPFLKQYLRECLEIGYPDAPMEQEAIVRSHEIVAGGSGRG